VFALVALIVGAGALLPGAAAPTAASANPDPIFHAEVHRIRGAVRHQITGSSWHRGCPVARSQLRVIRLAHWGFDDQAHPGSLIVKHAQVHEVVTVMRSLFRHRFPIRQMVLVDRYGADDHRSMNHDNTSAFNCRYINGQPGVWSQHAYGRAIDINPIENPYVTASGSASPPAGRPYVDRSRHAKGMVHSGDFVVRAFEGVGWGWGGDWAWPKDYQHFSSNGK
jgi:hypothetical protein